MTPIERKARELLPCPFCGNADVTDDEGCFQTGGHWEVRCGNPSCFAHEPCGATYDEAVERWNRRTALTPPAGGLPELPVPVAVIYPDSGLRNDEHALALWQAHQYDTGGEPLFSADQLHSYCYARAITASRVGDDAELIADALEIIGMYGIPLTGDLRKDHVEYGEYEVSRELQRREVWRRFDARRAAAPQVALNRGGEEG